MNSTRRAMTVSVRSSGQLTARTGAHCPVSGLWSPSCAEHVPAALSEGSVMPAYGNDAVEWTLLEPCRGVPGSGLQT